MKKIDVNTLQEKEPVDLAANRISHPFQSEKSKKKKTYESEKKMKSICLSFDEHHS